MLFLGIDPGKAGGIAILLEDGSVQEALKMPETEADIYKIFEAYRQCPGSGSRHAMLERVSASPQMGVVSAFTFGKGYGSLLMALTAARIPFDLVSPVKWQNVMGCRSGGDKNVTKRRAQQLFPGVKVTHAIADALLLAEFCRRLHRQVHEEKDSQQGQEQVEIAPIYEANRKRYIEPAIQAIHARDKEAYAALAAPTRPGASSQRAPRSRVRSDRG